MFSEYSSVKNSLVEKFEKSADTSDRRTESSGRPRTVTTDENVLKVEQYFEDNPTASVRRAAQELNIKRESLRIIARYLANLFPYKIQINQHLKVEAIAKRKAFCQMLLAAFEAKDLSDEQIWFSDEAHFWLSGYVNKQNYRFWGSEQPFITQSTPLNPERLTVWAALSSDGIHYFFLEGNVNGSSYKKLLTERFFPAISAQNTIDDYWFMQDGATPHRTKDVFEAIFDCFDTRVIGPNYPKFAHGGLEWPPYSPDLNPLDFFFWGYLKDKVYKNSPRTLSELKSAISFEIDNMDIAVLLRVVKHFSRRLELCLEGDGAHFEHIYV